MEAKVVKKGLNKATEDEEISHSASSKFILSQPISNRIIQSLYSIKIVDPKDVMADVEILKDSTENIMEELGAWKDDHSHP